MQLSSIIHRSAFTDCYAVNENEIIINIRTGKDVTAVNIIQDDPYIAGSGAAMGWTGQVLPMELAKELRHCYIWGVRLTLEYKRLQYYFEICSHKERVYMLEDDFYLEEEFHMPGRIRQYFKFPWLNPSDVNCVPDWVGETVWYQIMPDRFCRGNQADKRMPLIEWDSRHPVQYQDFYGGDLRGIIHKLDYLQDLGINGIYLTPVFESTSSHKYNTTDYTKIDPDFGTEEDMKELVEKAHQKGIRIMLDAVFNHSGTDFFAWQDVLEKGKDSRYADWFFIGKWPVETGDGSTKDGRYYSFAFERYMPKLNTQNKETADYLAGLCRHWVETWGIDGIRFDVGNEISHSFLKRLRRELKAVRPDIFLLGEIWHDAVLWLQGDEYDSVMNFPFMESMHNFWLDKKQTAQSFMYSMNRCYSMYQEQTNQVLFNFLDNHDVGRVYTRYGDLDIFFQQLTVLLTMQGSPCLYYGTEIAMEGGEDPDNRRCMPWERIESGAYEDIIREVKQLTVLRRQYPQLRSAQIVWKQDALQGRLVHYEKWSGGKAVSVYLNAGEQAASAAVQEVLYSRHYQDGCLEAGGVLVGIGSEAGDAFV